MPDVLSTLAKLPPVALYWAAGQAHRIVRGVMGTLDYPLTSPNDVALWNREHGVTPEQAEAMFMGATLGWEVEGADLKTPPGKNVFIYTAPLQIMLQVQTAFEEDAAKVAEQSLDKLVVYFNEAVSDHFLTVHRDGKLDLVDEQLITE